MFRFHDKFWGMYLVYSHVVYISPCQLDRYILHLPLDPIWTSNDLSSGFNDPCEMNVEYSSPVQKEIRNRIVAKLQGFQRWCIYCQPYTLKRKHGSPQKMAPLKKESISTWKPIILRGCIRYTFRNLQLHTWFLNNSSSWSWSQSLRTPLLFVWQRKAWQHLQMPVVSLACCMLQRLLLVDFWRFFWDGGHLEDHPS